MPQDINYQFIGSLTVLIFIFSPIASEPRRVGCGASVDSMGSTCGMQLAGVRKGEKEREGYPASVWHSLHCPGFSHKTKFALFIYGWQRLMYV